MTARVKVGEGGAQFFETLWSSCFWKSGSFSSAGGGFASSGGGDCFPSSGYASAIQIVRPLESIAET